MIQPAPVQRSVKVFGMPPFRMSPTAIQNEVLTQEIPLRLLVLGKGGNTEFQLPPDQVSENVSNTEPGISTVPTATQACVLAQDTPLRPVAPPPLHGAGACS